MSKPQLAAIQHRLDALEQKAFGHARRRLTKRQVAELEGISTREVMRRVKRGGYAPPEIENNRCYWWSDSYRRTSGKADTAAARAARNPRLRARHAAATESDKHVSPRGTAR
jgi:hypothetical protein